MRLVEVSLPDLQRDLISKTNTFSPQFRTHGILWSNVEANPKMVISNWEIKRALSVSWSLIEILSHDGQSEEITWDSIARAQDFSSKVWVSEGKISQLAPQRNSKYVPIRKILAYSSNREGKQRRWECDLLALSVMWWKMCTSAPKSAVQAKA